MLRKINIKTSVNTMLIMLVGLSLYHLVILLGLIPFDQVWGGRLESKTEMYQMESIALFIIFFLIIVVLLKVKIIKNKINETVLSLILWIFTVYFIINTATNILSENIIETLIFTPITIVITLLCARIAVDKSN